MQSRRVVGCDIANEQAKQLTKPKLSKGSHHESPTHLVTSQRQPVCCIQALQPDLHSKCARGY